MRFVLGVDEAGRGPLAGPVAIGVVMVPEGFNVAKEFPGIADSKKLSEKERERIYKLLKARANTDLQNPYIQFCVRFGGHEMIDRRGIAVVVRSAVARGVRSLAPETDEIRILLDGSLKAPPEYHQQTIIGGDENVPLISLASIVAKVRRDRLMKRLAKKYPHYGFEIHKGYGTAAHYKALKKHGPSPLHRRSFLHS